MKFLLILLALFYAQFSFSQTIDPYVRSISLARLEVDSNVSMSPYQKIQHDIFKRYFIELGDFISDLDESDRLTKRLHAYIENEGMASFCTKMFLENVKWQELIRKCTKNRFFLCAEEVNSFKLHQESLKQRLTVELQEEFTRESTCEI